MDHKLIAYSEVVGLSCFISASESKFMVQV